jgi:hypothetical protein
MLKKLYWAFSTHHMIHDGTEDQPVLILGDNEKDVIHHNAIIPGGIQPGSSHMIMVPLPEDQKTVDFDVRRMGLRGSDAWHPQFVFVFGEEEDGQGRLNLVPIALQYYSPQYLSASPGKGVLSIPLCRAVFGSRDESMTRMLILIQNDERVHAGTKSPVTLTVEGANDLSLSFEIKDNKLANPSDVYLEIFRLDHEFIGSDVTSIRMSIGGDDQWRPKGVWIIGLDHTPDGDEHLIPFVHIPSWERTGLPMLSTDPKEGVSTQPLYQAFL